MLGEFPEFSETDKQAIRRALHRVWQEDHLEKNASSDRRVRDELSKRMRWYEDLMEKVGQL